MSDGGPDVLLTQGVVPLDDLSRLAIGDEVALACASGAGDERATRRAETARVRGAV